MPTEENKAFANRLNIALKRATKGITTANDLATQFNLRHPNDPITSQAAQKWLTGKSKPTSDKIRTLAEWLHVSEHWLRFGPPDSAPRRVKAGAPNAALQNDIAAPLSEKEAGLIARTRLLSEHQFFLISELVDQLAAEREMWARSDEEETSPPKR